MTHFCICFELKVPLTVSSWAFPSELDRNLFAQQHVQLRREMLTLALYQEVKWVNQDAVQQLQ